MRRIKGAHAEKGAPQAPWLRPLNGHLFKTCIFARPFASRAAISLQIRKENPNIHQTNRSVSDIVQC